jgi:phosphonoacetaldehyde hydrolase
LKLLNPAVPPQTVFADRLEAVVLDWAGTTVDFGSVAPARTLEKLFASRDIQLTHHEVRRDMGLPKKEHIRGILSMPRIRELWASIHGWAPEDSDVDAMYADFIPMQFSCLMEYSSVIPGVAETVAALRDRGLKIGSTTGYTREMLDLLLQSSAREGYVPDCSVTPGEAGSGRPHPFMMFECAIRMQVYPMSAIAKVGDTPVDILEGLNAGTWSVGVAGTGNMLGLTRAELLALSEADRATKLADARAELEQAGAHFVVDSVADLPPVLDAIDSLLEDACTQEASQERDGSV